MLPVLLDLKFVKIYTFGVFLVLAFFWSAFLLWKNIRLTSHKEQEIFDGLFYCLIGALFFGRLVYVILNFAKFGFNPMKFILINGYPGISIYGAILGGFLVLLLYLQTKKIKFFDIADYFVPAIFLAIAIGKLGSFFSGVEVGARTSFFLAIKYANFAGFRHITSLYESLLFFLGAYLAQKILFNTRRSSTRKGTGFYFFFWYFGLVYVLFDPLKSVHGNFFGRSFNQVISSVLLLTATLYFVYHYRSLFLKKTQQIINFVFTHGHHTFKKLHRATRKKTQRGDTKNSDSNS